MPKNSIAKKPFSKSCKSNLLEEPKSFFIGVRCMNLIAVQTPIQIGTKVKSTKRRAKGVRPRPSEKEQIVVLEQIRPITSEPRM